MLLENGFCSVLCETSFFHCNVVEATALLGCCTVQVGSWLLFWVKESLESGTKTLSQNVTNYPPVQLNIQEEQRLCCVLLYKLWTTHLGGRCTSKYLLLYRCLFVFKGCFLCIVPVLLFFSQLYSQFFDSFIHVT